MIIFHSQSEHEFCKSFIPLRAKRAAFAGHVCPDFFQLQPSFRIFPREKLLSRIKPTFNSNFMYTKQGNVLTLT